MTVHTVKPGQTIWDVSTLHFGSPEGIMNIITKNKLSGLNAEISPGQKLVIDGEVSNNDVVRYFAKKGIEPATADIDSSAVQAGFTTGFSTGYYS